MSRLSRALVLGVVLAAALSIGCADTLRTVKHANATYAIALSRTRTAAAAPYRAAVTAAIAANPTREGYNRAMEAWHALRTSLDLGRDASYALDAVLSAIAAGATESWLQAAACVLAAVVPIIDGAGRVGLELPPEMQSALGLFRGLSLQACRGSSQ